MTIGGLDRNAQQETYPRRCAALANDRLGKVTPFARVRAGAISGPRQRVMTNRSTAI